jgi:hypothetical protein
METPRPVNLRACGVSSGRARQAVSPSLPVREPMVPVTPSFFRLLSRSTTHTAGRRRPKKKGETPRPCPFHDPNTDLLAHLARSRIPSAPPCPHCPQWGLREQPELSAPGPVNSCPRRFLCSSLSPAGYRRFRVAPPGSIDSGRSKQRGLYLLRSLFCSLVPRSIKQSQNLNNSVYKCSHFAYSEVHD